MLKFSMSQFHVPLHFRFFSRSFSSSKMCLVKVKYIYFKSEVNFIAVEVLYIKLTTKVYFLVYITKLITGIDWLIDWLIFAQRSASSISAKFRARISHDIIIDTKNMFIMYGGKKITPRRNKLLCASYPNLRYLHLLCEKW